MLMFTLAISCLTTSNLPWFMDLTFQVLMKYCSFSIGLYFHHQTYPQLGIVSTLAQPLHSEAISPLFSSSILGTYWPGEFVFQSLVFLSFHTVHGVLEAWMMKWFAIVFSSGPCFVRTLHHDPSISCGPTRHAHSFIELDKAVIHVISLARKWKSLSYVQLFVTLWTIQSMEFSRPEYWSE